MIKTLLGRAALGGIAGGAVTGNWDYGTLAGGAVAGGLGWNYFNRAGRGFNIAGKIGVGLGSIGRRIGAATVPGEYMASLAYQKGARNTFKAGLGRLSGGFGTASNFVGKNALRTNKYTGYAMGIAGIGAGAYIGNSILRSNRR